MADPPAPPHADESLTAQLEARERASREDAAVWHPRRAEAAARALGLGLGVPVPEAAAGRAPAPEAAAPEPTVATPAPAPAPAGSEPASRAADAGRPFARAGVPLPIGGPAAVTTGVLAAAAAQRSARDDEAVMELRPTVLATDIDRIGDQLVVLRDRLELRDRHGGLRRHVDLADIADVEVQRRLTSAVLQVRTRTTTDLVVKGLRPEQADEARSTILALRPVPPPADLDERALVRCLMELHRAGVIDERELAAKTEVVARLTGRPAVRP